MYTGTCGPHLTPTLQSFRSKSQQNALNRTAEHKHRIRQQVLKKRRQLSIQQQKDFSGAVIEHIIASQLWQQAQHIGIYLAINGELNIEALKRHNKTLYVPTVEGSDMQFHTFTDETQLIEGPYKIRQPEFLAQHQPPPLDLCLVPLVAFDRSGHRLGMGGGFYDRYFANNTDTELVGIAYGFQEHTQLPVEEWDVKLQHIFTEHGHIST